jgi:hypothetical protein
MLYGFSISGYLLLASTSRTDSSSARKITAGTSTDELGKKSLSQAMIHEDTPQDIWTHVYTDGLATAAEAVQIA